MLVCGGGVVSSIFFLSFVSTSAGVAGVAGITGDGGAVGVAGTCTGTRACAGAVSGAGTGARYY